MNLYTGVTGIKLKNILDYYNNVNFDEIQVRCKWKDIDGTDNDDLIGFCQYQNGELIPLDGDNYSLDDLYVEWRILTFGKKNSKVGLIVWEDGYLPDELF